MATTRSPHSIRAGGGEMRAFGNERARRDARGRDPPLRSRGHGRAKRLLDCSCPEPAASDDSVGALAFLLRIASGDVGAWAIARVAIREPDARQAGGSVRGSNASGASAHAGREMAQPGETLCAGAGERSGMESPHAVRTRRIPCPSRARMRRVSWAAPATDANVTARPALPTWAALTPPRASKPRSPGNADDSSANLKTSRWRASDA